jgi:D-3-phosphoglycerate dehydrogenase
MLVVRHRDRPGVLAHVFDHLRNANLNVQETENIVFEGAEAAVARINLDGEPSRALCGQIQGGNENVLDLQVVSLPARGGASA